MCVSEFICMKQHKTFDNIYRTRYTSIQTFIQMNVLCCFIIGVCQWVSQWLLFNVKGTTVSSLLWQEQVTVNKMTMMISVLYLYHYSVRSLKQSTDRHGVPLGHIFMIPSQLVFTACLAEKQQINSNLIVFGLTWARLEPWIYCTPDKHAKHPTTDAVHTNL